MTARDLMAIIRAAGKAHDPVTCFLNLAAHLDEARLANGARLLDPGDFRAFLLECAEVAESAHEESPVPSRHLFSQQHCHRCGHPHEGTKECGFEIGGGRICRCEMEMGA